MKIHFHKYNIPDPQWRANWGLEYVIRYCNCGERYIKSLYGDFYYEPKKWLKVTK